MAGRPRSILRRALLLTGAGWAATLAGTALACLVVSWLAFAWGARDS
jgi:hypothetical protein